MKLQLRVTHEQMLRLRWRVMYDRKNTPVKVKFIKLPYTLISEEEHDLVLTFRRDSRQHKSLFVYSFFEHPHTLTIVK